MTGAEPEVFLVRAGGLFLAGVVLGSILPEQGVTGELRYTWPDDVLRDAMSVLAAIQRERGTAPDGVDYCDRAHDLVRDEVRRRGSTN